MSLAEFTDSDNDGFSAAFDCDDRNPAVNPDAVEVLNGIDDNCDGRTDWCLDDYDADCDGYFREDRGGEDCDDGNDQVKPGMAELCGDGLDNDCDDSVGDCALAGKIELKEDVAFAQAVIHGYQEEALAGYSIAGLSRPDGDNADLLVGAPLASVGGAHCGAIYLVSGPITESRTLAQAAVRLAGEAEGDMFGYSVFAWRNPDSDFNTAFWLVGARKAGGGGHGRPRRCLPVNRRSTVV